MDGVGINNANNSTSENPTGGTTVNDGVPPGEFDALFNDSNIGDLAGDGYDGYYADDDAVQNINFTSWPPPPEDVTAWLVEPRWNASAPCPLGFVCDGERQANCTKIRAVSLSYGFGDVHAGGYCPEGVDTLQLCPVGNFCPTADQILICPANFFCPYKTAYPQLECSSCAAGEETLVRDWYGYILLFLLFVLMILWIGLARARRTHSEFLAKFVDLSSRSLDSAKQLYQRKQRKEQLERLKPKLFAILKRLEQMEQERQKSTGKELSSSTSSLPSPSPSPANSTIGFSSLISPTNSNSSTTNNASNASLSLMLESFSRGKIIQYQVAGRLFDALDNDRNGRLDFDELQGVLELEPEQLKAFIQRMNELAARPAGKNDKDDDGNDDDATNTMSTRNTVSRPVFTRYFLRVLEESTQFGPTPTEVEELFQELSHGEEVAAYANFFDDDSRLTLFLSDPQINILIAQLRKAVAKEPEEQQQHHRGITRLTSALMLGVGGGESTTRMRTSTRKSKAEAKGLEEEIEVEEQGIVMSSDLDIDPYGGSSGTGQSRTLGPRQASEGLSGSIHAPPPLPPRRTIHQSQRMSTGVRSFFHPAAAFPDTKRYIHHDSFVKYYAQALSDVTTMEEEANKGAGLLSNNDSIHKRGIDLAFENLSLSIQFRDKKVNVVDQVSGRLPAKTMTALMGGSGAGKTSLLNALCGRAFYGETTGTIRINGHVTSIDEHKSSTGFVPQDDIVHAELTVKENLMYSGKFTLPRGTATEVIEELADQVLAQLGLSRVADSIVGDVNRRGVSGGEKKRVNIGVELMSRPSILFLDEPTSGLDSSSALMVMGSLKNLVETQGVTVLSVIHQPRKAIFDSFDSLILLGVGGKMVFHGKVTDAQDYFSALSKPYYLPAGESVADWLIDVSSGRLTPYEPASSATISTAGELREIRLRKSKGEMIHLKPPGHADDEDGFDGIDAAVSNRGASSANFDFNLEKAKERRQELYDCWKLYYASLNEQERERYTPPTPYDLPARVEKPTFWTQLRGQIHRNLLMSWRNRTSKLLDTMMLVGAIVLISWLQGTTEVTRAQQPNLTFDQLVEGDPYEIPKTFPSLFKYALGPTAVSLEFGLKLGVIAAVLLGLMAAKALTSKRLEFFRESGSGWDINSYFLALNITSTMEHSLQMVIAAGCAYWLRDSLTVWYAYQIQFLMLMWLTVSWSLLIPLVVPANNTVLAVGFFMAFFGLLFSGGINPVTYDDIYFGDSAMALFSGIFSVTRYFIEGMTVQEARCLPAQSGFTVEPSSVNFPFDLVGSFRLTGLAQNDLSVIQRSYNGWYWGVYPALMVGLSLRVLACGIIHISDRSKQAKKSLWHDLKKRPLSRNQTFWIAIAFVWLTIIMFVLSGWLILNQTGETGIMDPPTTEEEATQLVGMAIDESFPGSQASDFAILSGANFTAYNTTTNFTG